MVDSRLVWEALATVMDPELHRDLVTLKMAKDVEIVGSTVNVAVELTTPACPLKNRIRDDVVSAVSRVPGVEAVNVSFGARVMESRIPGSLPKVKHTIAIGSGKGGVGKSTVAANLALALAQTGAKVGLMDADIYGPSIPLLMGAQGQRPTGDGQSIRPIEAHGIKLMSIGFLLPSAEDPVIWRGPMLSGVINQFLHQVSWGELDYLLIDLPPGTGDVPLTLVQTLGLSGAIIVVTPQQVASAIGTKTLRMFQGEHTRVPIIGIIENMAAFECPHCHTSTEIFSGGGGRELAIREGVPYLGSLPLDPGIRKSGDAGLPVVIGEPESLSALRFCELAGALAGQVSVAHFMDTSSLVDLPIC